MDTKAVQVLDDSDPVGDLGEILVCATPAGISDETRADYKVDRLKRAACMPIHADTCYSGLHPTLTCAAGDTHTDLLF